MLNDQSHVPDAAHPNPCNTCLVQASNLDRAVVALYRAARLAQCLTKDDPVDVAQSRLLASVKRLGPTRPSVIASDSHVDLSTASRQVDALVKKGLVEKSTDPQDARAALVQITAEGQSILSRLIANRSQAIAPALAHWSDADRDHLADLLGRFADDLDSYLSQEQP